MEHRFKVARVVGRSMLPFLLAGFLLGHGTSQATVLNHGLGAQIYVQATAGDQVTYTDHTYLSPVNGPISYTFTSTASGGGINGLAASATGSTTADYGYLDVSGSGFATPASGNGAASRVIPYVGGDPLAAFLDQFQVTSDTLAPGTATSLTLFLSYTGSASVHSEGTPPNGYQSTAAISSLYRLQYISRYFPQGEIDVRHTLGTFSDAIVVPVEVGDVLQLEGRIYGYGEAASYDALGPSSFAFEDPSTVNIGGLAPGVSLVTGSGHDYTPFNPTSVPEPGTVFLLGAGILGFVVHRRRTRQFFS